MLAVHKTREDAVGKKETERKKQKDEHNEFEEKQ